MAPEPKPLSHVKVPVPEALKLTVCPLRTLSSLGVQEDSVAVMLIATPVQLTIPKLTFVKFVVPAVTATEPLAIPSLPVSSQQSSATFCHPEGNEAVGAAVP